MTRREVKPNSYVAWNLDNGDRMVGKVVNAVPHPTVTIQGIDGKAHEVAAYRLRVGWFSDWLAAEQTILAS